MPKGTGSPFGECRAVKEIPFFVPVIGKGWKGCKVSPSAEGFSIENPNQGETRSHVPTYPAAVW
jgi:hypothetical protein